MDFELITDTLITFGTRIEDDHGEPDQPCLSAKKKEFWGEAWFYSSTAGVDSALIIRISEIAAVTRQKPSQR
jgi:hypothetical protein